MKGLKIRSFGTALPDFARTLGAEPVSVAFAELYAALERGTVDAAFVSCFTAYPLRMYKVAKYILELNLGPPSGVMVVSKRTWDTVSAERRQSLEKIGEELTVKGWQIGRQASKEGTDMMVAKGMELLPVDPALMAASRAAVRQVIIPAYIKRAGPEGKAIFNQYLAQYAGFTVS